MFLIIEICHIEKYVTAYTISVSEGYGKKMRQEKGAENMERIDVHWTRVFTD